MVETAWACGGDLVWLSSECRRLTNEEVQPAVLGFGLLKSPVVRDGEQ